jgi:predicted dinucleotide-binding enzyme
MDLIAEIPAMRVLDAGDLTQAAPIEAFTAVLLELNLRYKTRVAIKFTGKNLPV